MILNRRFLVAAACALIALLVAISYVSSDAANSRSRTAQSGGGLSQAAHGSEPSSNDILDKSGGKRRPRVTIDVAAPQNVDELLSALRSILPDPNQHRQRKALLDLMEHLTPESAPAVRELMRELKEKGIGSDFAWWAFCTRWGEVDPKGALDYFLAHPDDPGAKSAMGHIVEGWVGVDSSAARTWLATHKDAPFFKDALFSYVTNFGRQDLSQATNDLFGMGVDQDALWNNVGPLVKNARERDGFQGVEDWFDGLTDDVKVKAFEHAMWAMKDADLATAVAWFTANADKPWRNDYHFHHIATRYAQQDPQAAIDWVMSIPSDPGRPGTPAGLRPIIETWAAKDPNASEAWIRQHLDEPWSPRAVMAQLNALARTDANRAGQYLASFPPEFQAAVRKEKN